MKPLRNFVVHAPRVHTRLVLVPHLVLHVALGLPTDLLDKDSALLASLASLVTMLDWNPVFAALLESLARDSPVLAPQSVGTVCLVNSLLSQGLQLANHVLLVAFQISEQRQLAHSALQER